MKRSITILAALAAISGAAICAFKYIEMQKSQKNAAGDIPDENDQYAPLSDKLVESEETANDTKADAVDNIRSRHQAAAVEMKESLVSFLEKDVPENENNKARLGQIFEVLEEI